LNFADEFEGAAEADLQLDAGLGGVAGDVRQEEDGERVVEAQAQAGLGAGQVSQALEIQLVQGCLGAGIKPLAASGEVEPAAGAALEEGLSLSEGCLEGANVLGDDGASHAEVLGGAFEAAGLDSSGEGLQPVEVSRELARRHQGTWALMRR
jgi:hypothetical protein